MRGWTALLIILWIIRLCWGHFCRVCTIHQGCMESADSSRYRRGFSTRSGIVLAAMRISGMRVPDGRKRLWKRRHGRRSLSHYFSLFIRYLWTVLRYLHLLVVKAGMVFSALRIGDLRVSGGRKRLRKRKSRKRGIRFLFLRLFQNVLSGSRSLHLFMTAIRISVQIRPSRPRRPAKSKQASHGYSSRVPGIWSRAVGIFRGAISGTNDNTVFSHSSGVNFLSDFQSTDRRGGENGSEQSSAIS